MVDDMTYPYGMADLLDAHERARLEAIVVPLGHGRAWSAADLVVGWAGEVDRLYAERGLGPGEDHDAWNAHDYVGALLHRGRVQRALDQLDPDLQPPAARAVAHFDELLASFTEPDERGLLRRFAAPDAGREWWW
jgi:hypothetical protein